MNANNTKRYKEFAIHLWGGGEIIINMMFYQRLSVCIGG
jgi:hypothetical protein